MFMTNMLIIDIVPIDKKRKRIILEDNSCFCLYSREIKNLELETDDQITEEKWIKIEEILEKRAKERALYLLNDMDKTEYELSEKLKAGFYPQEIIDNTISYLKSYHYIDDNRFARRYIEQKKDSLSYRQLMQKLMNKGISKEILNEVLEEKEDGELEALDKLLRKKNIDFSTISTEEKQKIYAYFIRRGFTYENIVKKINEFESHQHLT